MADAIPPSPLVRTRFAPSPNGPLHLGHAYAALVAHDLARARGGSFRLRIEDIDRARSRPALAEAILADLAWLGLAWDGPVVFQSHRLAAYAEAGERLKALGVLYPCRCTRAEIAAAATAMGPDGPIYPGTCRGKSPASRAPDSGDAAWRLDMARALALAQDKAGGPLIWEDERAGPQRASPDIFGDVVLLRGRIGEGGGPAYHLAATLDDAADGITLVTRGMDLFAASHVHRLLQALLDLPVPRWHHHPLLMETDGEGRPTRKLAKRRGSPALADRRLAGEDGLALADALRRHSFPPGIGAFSGKVGTGIPPENAI